MFKCHTCASPNIQICNLTLDKQQQVVSYSCLCNSLCHEYFYGTMPVEKFIDVVNVLINRNNTLRMVGELIQTEEDDQAELVKYIENDNYEKIEG